jgi:SAM-dependent methyltransferase
MAVQEPDFEHRWQQLFSHRGATLDDDAGIAGWTNTGLAARVRRFQLLWNREQRPPGLWLDIGCGAGTYSRLLNSEGHSVIGMDYAVPSLQKAQGRQGSTDIQWAAAEIQQLPLRDASVDGILCFGVMQALASPNPALAELSRVIKPGGELWIDALNLQCAPTIFQEALRRYRNKPSHLRYDAPGRFAAAISGTALDILETHWLPILPRRLQRFQGVMEAPAVSTTLAALPPIGCLLSHSFIVRARRPLFA